MLTENEITQFIREDILSTKKRLASVGERYYEGRHDIRDYKLYFYNGDGVLVEDTNRSNIKISHPFFTELVDQEVQYLLSGEDYIRSDLPDLQNAIDEYCDEEFRSELAECITDAVSKGFGYIYFYKNTNGKLCIQSADTMGVVEVKGKDTDDGCDYVIYYYVDRIAKNDKKIRRIQVWDAEKTYYYVQDGLEGKIIPDASQAINPKPHSLYTRGDGTLYYENFGFIPFLRLDNNRKQMSALCPIKDLIDDYDLMSCGLSNNLQDISEGIYVVKGFQGDSMDELIQNVRIKKHIGVDATGDLDIKTIDIPYEARRVKLELDEKNIYRFGMGLNSAMVGDGNITNVVIKSRYALLDLKCNKFEIRLKKFLRQILDVILADINRERGTDYQQKDVYLCFEREVMTNASDNAQIKLTEAQTEQTRVNTLLNIASVLDNETIIKNICEVLDIDYEDIKDRLPENEEETTNQFVTDTEGWFN